jgi:hypothetical protein
MAAREAASARKESRALCGVMTARSRIGMSGMIWAMTGSSGAAIFESSKFLAGFLVLLAG